MNNKGLSLIAILILLAVSAGAGYYIVDNLWKPQVDANMRLAYIGGVAVGVFVVLSFFGSMVFGGRKKDHIPRARQALADEDPVTASEIVYPLLRRCLGDDCKLSDDVFSVLEEAYEQAGQEADIPTLRGIHQQMVQIAAEHQGSDGLIQDPEANAAYNQLNSQAEAVIQSFPRLG